MVEKLVEAATQALTSTVTEVSGASVKPKDERAKNTDAIVDKPIDNNESAKGRKDNLGGSSVFDR